MATQTATWGTEHAYEQIIHPSWIAALDPVGDQIDRMGQFLREELAAHRGYLPPGPDVLKAFTGDFEKVRVLVVGQDPYPTPGHAMGLSFSVAADVRPIPGSLENIYSEYQADLGYPQPTNGDLTPWFAHGVLLLNRALSVEPGKPASHRGAGWEPVTEQAIRALAQRESPLVAILWGRDAQAAGDLLAVTPTITSAHPSPLSAHRGFLGSRPFSRANELLVEQGGQPVDWRLP